MTSATGAPSGRRGLLSAVLVVRDEAAGITECLDTLHGLVDETVVYDTGSVDATRELARAAGATVFEGFWNDDFARARNAAADAAGGEWLLVLDADHRVVADPGPLRTMLARERAADMFRVLIDNESHSGGGYTNWGSQLVRAGAVHWSGAVHERALASDGGEPATATLPEHLLSLRHLGYADPGQVRRKGLRNARIAQAQLDSLTAARPRDPAAIAEVLLALGRSLISAEQAQAAVDTFETIREIVPGTSRVWVEATENLARLLLAAGFDQVVVALAGQLAEAGSDPRYCAWLQAQAIAQLGRPAEALELIRGVDELVDSAGRCYDLGQVRQARELLTELLAQPAWP